MAVAMVNGRRMTIPEVVTGRQLQAAAGIDPSRRIMQRTWKGNYLVKPDDQVRVEEGSVFIDAPQRVKGTE